MKPEERMDSGLDEIEKQAAQLDALINERQRRNPPSASTPEVMLVDQLIAWAATTEPTVEFVAQLEEQLQTQFSQQASPQPDVHQQPTSPLKAFRPVITWSFNRSRLAFAVGVLLLCMGLLWTPVVRATVWDWLYGFGLVEEAQIVGLTIPAEMPVQPTNAPAPLTLAAIQQQAPFSFQPPTALPVGLHFTGGFVMPTATETIVTLAYHTSDEPANGYALDAPLLFVAISDGAIPNRPIVAAEQQQAVLIGQNVGIYTHGNWQSATPGTSAGQTGPLFWNGAANAAWLTWQADDLNYLLYAQGLDFTAGTMAQIAESME